jgi:hypothetical protein
MLVCWWLLLLPLLLLLLKHLSHQQWYRQGTTSRASLEKAAGMMPPCSRALWVTWSWERLAGTSLAG